jgi:hypothetical protein
MDKEEFVSVLGRKGYVAKNESSVVIVYAHNIQNEKEKNTFLSQIKAVVQECEYAGSYGVKFKTSGNLADEIPTHMPAESTEIPEDADEYLNEDEFGQVTFL